MKNLFFIFCIITPDCFAQGGKYGATPEDSVQCVQNLSLYSEFYKQKNYQDAIAPWRWLMDNCPKASKKMYADGVILMEYEIKNATGTIGKPIKDASRREKFIDTLMMVYDLRIKYWGEEGLVLGKKGVDMLKYRKDKPEDAFKALSRSVELLGNESEAGALVAYFQASVEMLKKKKQKRKM